MFIARREDPVTKLTYERSAIVRIFDDCLAKGTPPEVNSCILIEKSKDHYIIKA